MKKIFLLIIVIMLNSCNKSEESNNEIPQSLKAKRELLLIKKKELVSLKNEIAALETQIDSLDPEVIRKTTVTSMIVKKMDFERFSEIQGVVQSDEVVKISSEIPGRLLNIYVENGDFVRRGQLIAKLDVGDIQKKLEEIQKSYELAKEVYERQNRLWKKNIGSEIQFLSAKNNKERLEKGIESIKHQLKKANIYAPLSGVIDRKSVEPGEIVSPGFPLMLILNTRKMKVASDVPETYLSQVHFGDLLSIKIPALNIETQEKISRIGNTINPANRTFSVEVKLKNHKGELKPNLLAVVLLKDYSKKDAIVIPSELIQYEISGKPFVMLASKDKDNYIAKKVYITTGEEYNGQTVVIDGINENNILIVKGARSLSENEVIEFEIENINHDGTK